MIPSEKLLQPKRALDYLLLLCGVLGATVFAYTIFWHDRCFLLPGALLCLLVMAAYLFPARMRAAAELCFTYRWALALLVFTVCVLLKLSGSSIACFNCFFPTQLTEENSTLFMWARTIRSDEYGVQTMKFFSQAYNNYSLYSHQMSLSDTNMVLDYYSPVWDITAIGKPLLWGYLLFGSETGLSWYWCGMAILLFMTALEMFRILTRGDKWLSVLGGLTVLLAPAIQWWFMPHMPIVILYAMALFCVGYYFFTARSSFAKWSFSALAAVTVIGFALSLFPSFQVPLTYFVLVLLTVCLIRDRKSISFCRKEWYRLALPVLFVAGVLAYFLKVSWNDIQQLMHTAYPGSRVDTGGDLDWRSLFPNLTALFLPYKDVSFSNNCEMADYLHMAPFFLLLFPRIFLYLRKRKSSELAVGTALFSLVLLTALFMCVGVPQWFARLTLLSYCNRMSKIYGWIGTVFTLWGVHILWVYPEMLKKWQKFAYPALYGCLWALTIDQDILGYFEQFYRVHNTVEIGPLLLAGEIILFALLLSLAAWKKKRLFAGWLAIVMLVAGGTVNPIEKGTGAVYNHPISQAIQEIAEEEPEACWLCLDIASYLSNFVMANGARVLNATNFYPDEEKWSIIDPQGIYDDVTNRYVNQDCTLQEAAESSVELLGADNIHWNLTPETLKELNIRYIFSPTDYTALLEKYGIRCTEISGQDGYTIYRLDY